MQSLQTMLKDGFVYVQGRTGHLDVLENTRTAGAAGRLPAAAQFFFFLLLIIYCSMSRPIGGNNAPAGL